MKSTLQAEWKVDSRLSKTEADSSKCSMHNLRTFFIDCLLHFCQPKEIALHFTPINQHLQHALYKKLPPFLLIILHHSSSCSRHSLSPLTIPATSLITSHVGLQQTCSRDICLGNFVLNLYHSFSAELPLTTSPLPLWPSTPPPTPGDDGYVFPHASR